MTYEHWGMWCIWVIFPRATALNRSQLYYYYLTWDTSLLWPYTPYILIITCDLLVFPMLLSSFVQTFLSPHHSRSALIRLLCCQCCGNELEDWPHPITPLINSIRESGRLVSIKPGTFCPCVGINSLPSFALLACLHFCKVLNTETSLDDIRFWFAHREHKESIPK